MWEYSDRTIAHNLFVKWSSWELNPSPRNVLNTAFYVCSSVRNFCSVFDGERPKPKLYLRRRMLPCAFTVSTDAYVQPYRCEVVTSCSAAITQRERRCCCWQLKFSISQFNELYHRIHSTRLPYFSNPCRNLSTPIYRIEYVNRCSFFSPSKSSK